MSQKEDELALKHLVLLPGLDGTGQLAEPAVRFYDKAYLNSFSLAETSEYVDAIFGTAVNHAEFTQWLHSKTCGHPYFMAFVCRQFAELTCTGGKLDAAQHWWEIFRRLENEKFSADLAHVTDREVRLLRAVARCEEEEINRKAFTDYARIYFTRLTDKGLLMRTGRGHYRLYHPLFREFLRQTK
jgi:hypothetical protein